MTNASSKQKCEDCPLAQLLETAIKTNRQLSKELKKKLYDKLLVVEQHVLN